MKLLSVRQPWAWLIVNGLKPIENRDRICNYRGELYIHASKTYDKTAELRHILIMIGNVDIYTHFIESLVREALAGGIVGKVQMVDCVSESDSPWFSGKYGYVFTDPQVLPFRPIRGYPGLFEINSAGRLHKPGEFFQKIKKNEEQNSCIVHDRH